ncbi:TRAP transporter small permease [Desulforhopalus vacuolatus]|uniref:TRAP transporter small permease n=1 Tax=Desulforhopalus vacuolatus TaxID=40414 RepID=UPI0019636876|nr:TRAP transporter small permease [Desulforhopalus vacuolatus]MBM9518201.1 TRAP transporter small permease [Desulforhopalus vacuolatus]
MYHLYKKLLRLVAKGLGGTVNVVDQILRYVVAIGVATIMFAIIFHICGRYFWGITYMGTMELLRYTMIWVSLLGAVLAFRAKEHVIVNIFEGRMSPRNLLRLSIVADTFLFVFLLAMVVGGVEISMRNMNQISLGLQIPMGYPYLAIPVGGGFMILYVLLNVVENILGLTTMET